MNKRYWENRFECDGLLYCTRHGNSFTESRLQVQSFWEYMAAYCDCRIKTLDFGCGPGRFMQYFNHYQGVDILPLHNYFPQGVFKQIEPGGHLPFKTHEFKQIISVTVLQHIVDEEEFRLTLTGLQRVLDPDGRIIICDDYTQGRTAPHVKVRDFHDYLDVIIHEVCDIDHVGSHQLVVGRFK